jgi:hypothetical protein
MKLMATLPMCTSMGGCPPLIYAAEAVGAYDEFGAVRPAKPGA